MTVSPINLAIDAQPSIARRAMARLASLWRLKLIAYISMVTWICVPYFLLGRIPLFAPHAMPITSLDRAVPFNPSWTIVYISLYAYMPLAAIFYACRRDVMRYVAALAIASAIACAIFLICPTTVPRPDIAQPPLLYSIIRQLDRPLNACPSLHAAFAVLAAIAVEPLIAGRSAVATMARIAAWAWAIMILYATLATRQHVVIDLITGAALGAVAWFISGRICNERAV